jgi:ribosomal-protein-alanine N-acetyltransferase
MTQKTKTDVSINWMVRMQLPQVVRIERDSFQFNWSEEDFRAALRQQNMIGMVATGNHRDADDRIILGFMIYELHKTKLHLLNIAVDPPCRGNGIGTAMVEKLINKLSMQRRQSIVTEVRETNLGAQLFFRAMGFQAIGTLRRAYLDTDEDAISFRYSLEHDS